jgi:outer membrane receptor protein involved in Fe transport
MQARLLSALICLIAITAAVAAADGIGFRLTDGDEGDDVAWYSNAELADEPSEEPLIFRDAAFQEQPPRVVTQTEATRTDLPAAALDLRAALLGVSAITQSLLEPDRRTRAVGVGVDFVLGLEAKPRSATDAGDLLGKSLAPLGTESQKRTPIVNDPRIRGSRIGTLASSGSYWVPARLDLDTTLSKIDSRLLSDVIVVKGPYAARYGPGLSHLDFQLLRSPRSPEGWQTHGATSLDYKVNGEQWYGQQTLWGGNTDWGFRAAYGHRTGNDYTSGNGMGIPSSYNSRDAFVSLGRDFCEHQSIEFNALRLDQTNVEFPGQAFDIDFLTTDGYEVAYAVTEQPWCDRWELDAWYNRTRFAGSAQRPGKRRQFPFLDALVFQGVTDVDSTSTGFRSSVTWFGAEDERLIAGADMRFVKQALNEVTSALGPLSWPTSNSPVPESYVANPGLFLEYLVPLGDRWHVTSGARADLAVADVTDDPVKLASLGTRSLPLAYILGSGQFDRAYGLLGAYITGEYEINRCWTAEIATGYAERPPSLTELYAAECFMFVLQNGLNTLTGDPRLRPERGWQMDAGLRLDNGWFRGRVGGFHRWVWDYITFENVRVEPNPAVIEQVQLKYVNTDLATIDGAELRGELDLTQWLTPFGTLSYVEGWDRTRNGDFATKPSSSLPVPSPSEQIAGLPRGSYSGITGAAKEPLPGISPLESRVGILLHDPGEVRRWTVELSARLVDGQDQVATSLKETPTAGFTIWNLRSYWQATDRLLLVGGVENFTDRAYREHLDFRSLTGGQQMFQPGRTTYVGAELNY